MKQLIVILFFLPTLLFAQAKPKKVEEKHGLKRGYLYGNFAMAWQNNISQKNLNSIANKRRNFGNNAFNFSFPELAISVYDNFYAFLGIQYSVPASGAYGGYNYLGTKYPQYNINTSSSSTEQVNSQYVGIGWQKEFKKFSVLPYVTYGVKTISLLHDKYLLTNDLNNKAYTYFIDFADINLRNQERITLKQIALNTRIYLNSAKGYFVFYVEPGFNYSRKDLDILIAEREELSGSMQTNVYDYRAGNLNASLQIGFSMRFFRVFQ